MEKNWLLVTPTQLPKLSVKKGNRKHIRWKAPPVGWLKLNFDGACRGNLGVSSFGVVIRNNKVKLLLGSYGALGVATNNEAEIRALLEGLKLCVTNKMTKIVIEGDSLVIIQGIIKRGFQSRNLNKWVPCISRLLNDIDHYEITHTYKEGNRVADCVARLGIDIPHDSTILIEGSAVWRKLLDWDVYYFLSGRSLYASISELSFLSRNCGNMAFFGSISCVNYEEDLRGQLQNLFFTVDVAYDAMEGLIGVALNHQRHWCDSKVLEATLIPVVDVLESSEIMVGLLGGFVKPLLVDAVVNCILSLPSNQRLSIIKVYF
ncbi:hypothetical protein SUGI_0602070 [Cryptomeria japonica]|nr:hypothetical protein SUGI_0602070 [Cryptomeria japonica]